MGEIIDEMRASKSDPDLANLEEVDHWLNCYDSPRTTP